MIEPRRLIAVSALFLLSGCSIFENSDQVVAGGGFVVADEPQAAEVGAGVLEHGGNAVDAAAATYLALSVTYPVAAGLGGGGLCVVHAQQENETFDFEPGEASGGGPYAIPGNVSGFARLQALYGRIPWQSVVSPAESLAAAGFQISQALADRLATSVNIIRLDATLSAEFLDESGELKPAGSRVAAPELAQTLSQIRTRGPEVFYRGAPASQIISYSREQVGALSAADLGSYTPTRSPAQSISIAGTAAYLPSASSISGRFAGAVLSHLVGTRGEVASGGSELASRVFSAAATETGTRNTVPLPPDLGATGFAAVDKEGLAIACGVTMNGAFGSGHSVASLGVTLASAPDASPTARSGKFLTPLIASSDGQVSLAGSGTGGPEGTAAILLALLQVANGEDIDRPGVLQPTGREPQQTVNAIGCREGICVASADPLGSGVGTSGN